ALLDEAVLRRVVGSEGIMAEQITHMVRLVESRRVRVHAPPFGVGAYQLLQGMLSLMWFEDQPPLAYAAGNSVGTVHDSPALVTRLQGAYDLALSDALPLRESLALLRATAKDYEDRE
ncbi:Scr1 family TA system antitoxin-like transcriptional regulator, partial [Streptomyces narbonensis]